MASTKKKVAGAIAGTVLLATPFIGGWEGLWTTAKPDTLAHGIPTVCYGETENVRIGDTYTKEQCQQMLAAKLPRYLKEIDRCIKVPVSDRTRAAYLSFAYNVGSGAFCSSRVLKLLNADQDEASCHALSPYNRSAGQYRQGLANRRAKEVDLCLSGLNDAKSLIGPDAARHTLDHAEHVNPKIAAEPKPILPAKTHWYTRFWHWLMS